LPNEPGSSVVFGDLQTNRKIGTGWTGVYRALNTAPTDAQRPVMATQASAGVVLPPGTYWLDWMSNGSRDSGPWAPPLTLLGQTTTGDGLQWTTSAEGALDGGTLAQPTGQWIPALDSGTLTWQGFPFMVEGTPLRPEVPWLDKWPVEGTLSPGECQDVAVTLDAAGLAPGTYSAELYVNGNDVLRPQVVVPVQMTVEPWLPTGFVYVPVVLRGH